MKHTVTVAAAAVLALTSVSGVALAKPGHDHGGPPGREGGPDGPPGRDYGGPPGRSDYGPPGHAYGHYKWRKGQRMGRGEWRRYPRVDWRYHHLRPPPPGYEWREVDGRYVLAAVATGLILSIMLNQ